MAIHIDNPMLVGHCCKKRKLPIATKKFNNKKFSFKWIDLAQGQSKLKKSKLSSYSNIQQSQANANQLENTLYVERTCTEKSNMQNLKTCTCKDVPTHMKVQYKKQLRW
jgi:uncharacterized protein YdaT